MTLDEYRTELLGDPARPADEANAVTLEISALQYFPWLIAEAEHAIAHRQLMPGRYIRVRNMVEQSAPGGDILPSPQPCRCSAPRTSRHWTRAGPTAATSTSAARTLAGYFGGIGQPNDYPLKWAREYLHYLTGYGVRQVLNVNLGTIFNDAPQHKPRKFQHFTGNIAPSR